MKATSAGLAFSAADGNATVARALSTSTSGWFEMKVCAISTMICGAERGG
jgi:hypothetical protein